MPQSRWERGFWAAVRGGGSFNPYPPEHWRPKKEKKVKRKLKHTQKAAKKDFLKEHIKVVAIPDIGKQLTFFD